MPEFPVIKGRELIKFLETLDFKVTRTKGSHSRLKSENTKEISNKFLNLF
jgi:predicted RNA binding protein YcfA (HicA-like mRNA interferase family)